MSESSPPASHPDPRPTSQVTPMTLPYEHTDLPAVGGNIGPKPEHFEVEEIPLYEPSGEGDHWYVQVEKREATTAELVDAISRQSGVRARDIGYAGMKDKQAVTTQWLSVPAGADKEPSGWTLPEGMKLLKVSRHGNKLRLGHLRGNRFRIQVQNVGDNALARAQALCERIATDGLGNFFGSQRFGIGGKNLGSALFGLDRGRLNRRGGNRAKFLASVIQSEHFNRCAVERIAQGAKTLSVGDVVRLEGSRALFVVEDCHAEQPRLDAREVHLTGPMIGPKMKSAQGQSAVLEAAAAENLGLDEKALSSLAPVAPGTRRDLMLYPKNISVEQLNDTSLVFSFELPAGSYAGLVIRAFTRSGPWLPREDQRSVTNSSAAVG